MTIQPISTAFGDPQRHDFSLPDRGRCPRDAPKSAESAGTGVAPRRGPGGGELAARDVPRELLELPQILRYLK